MASNFPNVLRHGRRPFQPLRLQFARTAFPIPEALPSPLAEAGRFGLAHELDKGGIALTHVRGSEPRMCGRPGLADVVAVARRLEGLLHLPVAVGHPMEGRPLMCRSRWRVPIVVLLCIR